MSQEEKDLAATNKSASGIRWGWIVAGIATAVLAALLLFEASDSATHYYMTVSEFIPNRDHYAGHSVKIAGVVKAGSLQKSPEVYSFVVEDHRFEIPVHYRGMVPDTFKEGVEVVVSGKASASGNFEAETLLAKCASKYQEGGLPPLESLRGQSIK